MNAVVQFQAPRLPFHNLVEERFGIDKSGWKVLVEAVFPAAASPDSIVMALAYCKARNLDIFKKPVQIVPIYDAKRGGMVDTVWPGIAELRTTAMRTGSFAGFEDTEYGPMIEEDLGGAIISYPEWAQCTVYRLVAGQKVAFVGPKTFWIETYATKKRDTKAPNAMWAKRPRGQLEKCAEAAALRRAFPEEIGNEYAAEEVEGQAFAARDVTPREAPNLHARLTAPKQDDFPGEGFTVHHPIEADDQIPDFDAEAPPASDAEAPAAVADEATQAGADAAEDEFPGDKPADPKTPTLATDLIKWADDLIRDLPDLTDEQLAHIETDRRELAKFAVLKAQELDKAKELEAAINRRKRGAA